MSDSKVEIILSGKDQASSEIKQVSAALQAQTAVLRQMASEMKGHQAAAGAAAQGMQRQREAALSLNGALSGLGKAVVGYLGYQAFVSYGKAVFEAGVKAQQLQNSFKAISGNAELAGKEMQFLRETSARLGLDFVSVADAYKGISAAAKGTALEGKATRDIFVAVSEASTVLGLSADSTSGALLAISQMISKGNVQAEELRGQLGERLPGAFKMAADAMGVSEAQLNKMLETGQVLAKDLIPKLADVMHKRFGPAARDSADGAAQALNRLSTEWNNLKVAISDSGFLTVMVGLMQQAGESAKFWADQIKEMTMTIDEKVQSTASKGSLQIKQRIAELEKRPIGKEEWRTPAYYKQAFPEMWANPQKYIGTEGEVFSGAGLVWSSIAKEIKEYQDELRLLNLYLKRQIEVEKKATWTAQQKSELDRAAHLAGYQPTISNIPATTAGMKDYYGLPAGVRQYYSQIKAAADKYGLPEDLIAAIIMTESGGNATAVSSAGAKGLMQFIPTTAAQYGIAGREFDPGANIMAGAAYIRDLLDKYNGDLYKALSAYSGDPNRPEASRMHYYETVQGYRGKGESGGDSYSRIKKEQEEAIKRAADQAEKELDIRRKFGDEYKKITLSETDYKRQQWADQVDEARKAGVSEIELAKADSIMKQKFSDEELAKKRDVAQAMAEIANDAYQLEVLRLQDQRNKWIIDGMDRMTAAIGYEKLVAEARLKYSKESADGARRALKSYYEEATDGAKGMERVISSGFRNMEDALVSFVTTGKLSFDDLINTMIVDLARLAIQQNITGPLAGWFQGLFSSPATELQGQTWFSGTGHAHGNAFGPSGLIPFAHGGVVNRPTIFPFATGVGLMGEAGEEAIMPLRRTASGDLGVRAEGGGTKVNVIINEAPPGTTVRETTSGGNNRQIEILLGNSVAEQVTRGGVLTKALETTYGLKRVGR